MNHLSMLFPNVWQQFFSHAEISTCSKINYSWSQIRQQEEKTICQNSDRVTFPQAEAVLAIGRKSRRVMILVERELLYSSHLIKHIHAGTPMQQQIHYFRVSPLSCQHQWRPASLSFTQTWKHDMEKIVTNFCLLKWGIRNSAGY